MQPANPNVAKAKEKGLHTDDFVLQFLRCEVFNTDLAVARYVRYWDKRVEIFGPVSAFMPMTLHQACRHDRVALEQGVVRVVDEPEADKRTYVFFDPSKQDFSKYPRESMARAIWYFLHRVLVEDELVQKKGLFLVAFPHHARFAQFDKKLARQFIGSIQGCLPVRLSAFHLCHPPTFFRIIFPIVKMFMSERTKKRLNVHAGSFEDVLQRLETKYGLTKADLPTEIGGERELDVKAWLAEREKAEKSSSKD